MAHTGTYDRSHVLPMPKKFIVLRAFQLALGCILFGFGIFGVIFAPFNGIILTFVTAIVTITTAGYTIGSERSPHAKAYNYWAILGLEIFCVVFWLISFALVATVVGLVAVTYYGDVAYVDTYYYDGDYYSTKMVKRAAAAILEGGLAGRSEHHLAKRYASGADAAIGIFGAAAGLGAAEFVLYIVSLVILSMRIHKHRKAGGHCQPGKGLPTTNLPGQPMYTAGTGMVQGVQQQQNTYIGGDYPEGKIELMPQTTVSPVSRGVTPVPNLQQQQQQVYQQHGPGGYAQYQQ